MIELILFDVNETLLDLRALRPHFEAFFGDPGVLSEWFSQLLRSALVLTMTDRYHDFGQVGDAALAMVAERRGLSLTGDQRAELIAGMSRLPPHSEVPHSLQRLQAAGYRLATLTNSPPHMLQAQMANAGLGNYFERLLSVQAVSKFKPALETYLMAAETLDVDLSRILFVAAHDWDVDGAGRAGCQTAFIARPGMVLGPLSDRPDYIGPDLAAIVDQLLGG